MRLIDADAFKEYIRDACKEMSHAYKDGGKWAKQITEDFCLDIDEQPTIEERKKGEWIIEPYDAQNDIFIHRCGTCMRVAMLGGHKPRFDYCPNCGADMRGTP